MCLQAAGAAASGEASVGPLGIDVREDIELGRSGLRVSQVIIQLCCPLTENIIYLGRASFMWGQGEPQDRAIKLREAPLTKIYY